MSAPTPDEAWRQARARAAWDANVPKPLDPGEPPLVAPEVQRLIAAVGPEWIREQLSDVPPPRWNRAYRRLIEREPSLPEKVEGVARRVASLEDERVAALEKRVEALEAVVGPGTNRPK